MVFCATLVWQMSNFAFNVVGAHQLGPAKYGILASAIGLSYLLNPVILAIQTVASRESTTIIVDEQGSQIRSIVNYYLSRVGVAALAVAAVIACFSPIIARILHLNSDGLVVIFSLVIPTLVASSIVRGVHQGTHRFERYSLGTIVEGLTKIGSAIVFLTFLWKSPISGMLALLLSAIAGMLVNFALLRHFPRPTSAVRPRRLPIRYTISTSAVFGLLAILLSIDTTAARLSLPAHTAGIYAGISLAGKIVYFATTALVTFVFPLFSSRSDEGASSYRLLAISILLVIVVSLMVMAVFFYSPFLVTDILLGAKYRLVANDIFIMGGIFAIYAITNLLVMFLLARRQYGMVIMLTVAVAVQIVGFISYHRSINDMMGVMAAAFSVALFFCASLVFVDWLEQRSPTANIAIPDVDVTTSSELVYARSGRHRIGPISGSTLRASGASRTGPMPSGRHGDRLRGTVSYAQSGPRMGRGSRGRHRMFAET